MVEWRDYLVRAQILRLPPAAREVLFERLIAAACGPGAATPRPRAAELREQTISPGVVLVHARRDDLDRIRLSMGLLVPPASLGHGAPVHALVCALIPEPRSREYLTLLARLSRLLAAPSGSAAFRSGEPDRVATELGLAP
ncbi:MAG: PTS sugar transporter subunit IIA [Kiritimatiellae bacterium]|nr:PTS sugar transporter subunit IIA [Kiritimatiellia bacterium]